MLMITLYGLVDFIKVIPVKVIALYAQMSLGRFSKELHFVSVCLGDFVIRLQCWIISLILWLQKIFIFMPRLVLACL